MLKYFIEIYDDLTEIALWLTFIATAALGYYVAGIVGAVGSVVFTFILSVFWVAPLMMISDIRKKVASIEAQRTYSSTSSPIASAKIQPSGGYSSSSNSPTTNKEAGHIKNYKGYKFTRGDGGVYVNGSQFSNVLEAERWVDEQ